MCGYTKLFLLITFLACALGNPEPRKPGYGPGEQDWGWVKVRPGANLFYWLYFTRAQVNSFYDRPLIIWHQGGPGGSAAGYGNFGEIGTLNVNGTERDSAWTKHVNVLYLDSPVGTGFSNVDNNAYLARNNNQIGKDFMVFIKEFYNKHPGFKKTPLYLFGESYGGKAVVEMGRQLEEKIKSGEIESNLKGIVMVDAWISPMDSVYGWSTLLFTLGVIDQNAHSRFTAAADNIRRTMDSGQYVQATTMWRALERDITAHTSGVNFYNVIEKVKRTYSEDTAMPMNPFLRGRVEDDLQAIEKLMNGPVKNALKIPYNIRFGAFAFYVFDALKEDFMKPVTREVEYLLNNTNLELTVLTAELDLIVDTVGTVHWVDNLRWKGRTTWQNAKRTPLIVNNVVEGYTAKAQNLAFYMILRSGHMIPQDNAAASSEILRRITKYDSR